MTPTSAAPASRDAGPHLSARQIEMLRTALLANLEDHHEHAVYLDQALESLGDSMGDDAAGRDREMLERHAQTVGEMIDEIEAALRRIDEGTYGVCERCGEPIALERLEALPHARHCLSCPRPGGLLR